MNSAQLKKVLSSWTKESDVQFSFPCYLLLTFKWKSIKGILQLILGLFDYSS